MCVVTKRLRLESRGFCYKIALYLIYLYIKFDYEIKGNPVEFQAEFPISLRPKLCCIYSQSLLLDTSVTCLRRPLHRDSEGANNIISYGMPMRPLYVHIHIELKQ